MPELTYKQLATAVQDRAQAITRNAEANRSAAQTIEEIADDTVSDSEAIAAKGVDRDSVAEASELAKVIRGLSEGAITYAARGDDTARAARAVGDQARTSHAGFQEAYDRRTVDLSGLDPTWLEQE